MTDDELALWRRFRSGDRSVRDTLILKYAPQVAVWVRRIAPHVPWANREDLLQEGTLGLMRAIEKFDPEKASELSTFARYDICGAIFDSNEVTRGISRHQHDRDRKVRLAYDRLMFTLGRRPTAEEIAGDLELTVEQVRKAITAMAIGFAAGLTPDENEKTLPDEPRATVESHDDRILLGEVLSSFREKQQLILIWYLCGHSDSEIGRRLAMQESAVSRARQRALKKLRDLLS